MNKKIFVRRTGVSVATINGHWIGTNDVLIKVISSAVSPGTESALISNATQSYLKKAVRYRGQIIDLIRSGGYQELKKKVANQKEFKIPSGYSLFGEVLAVGSKATEFTVGQHVVAVGDDASHGTLAVVKRGMVFPCTNNINNSLVALVAIALNAVELSSPEPFASVCVVGGGVIGQLLTRILTAAGHSVTVTDISESALEQCRLMGANAVVLAEHLSTLNRSYSRIFTTVPGGLDDMWDNISEAADVGAKIILVGAADLNVKRTAFYKKRLSFLTAYSYGAGRGEYQYEVLAEPSRHAQVVARPVHSLIEKSLDLIANKIIAPDYPSLISISEVEDEDLDNVFRASGLKIIKWVGDDADTPEISSLLLDHAFNVPGSMGLSEIDVVGNSAFFRDSHAPALTTNQIEVKSIFTRSPLGEGVNQNAELANAVLISTPHDQHWHNVCQLKGFYDVILIDKPLVTSTHDFGEYLKTKENILCLMSRRYSKYTQVLERFVEKYRGQNTIEFNFFVPLKDQQHPILFQGGPIIGEMIHHIDLAVHLCGAVACIHDLMIDSTFKREERQRALLVVEHESGDICLIRYWNQASPTCDKEEIIASARDEYLRISDFRSLDSSDLQFKKMRTTSPDKGVTNMWKYLKEEVVHSKELMADWRRLDSTAHQLALSVGCQP